MKVRDLLSQIQHLDADLELMCLCSDEGFAKQRRHPFKVFAVEALNASVLTTMHAGDVPQFSFGGGDDACPVAIFHITSDFALRSRTGCAPVSSPV